ncbi:MAG TPA: hypothetical protein DE045_11120 [Oceanospirillaceae bacterium]|nr:hypothetical protein [Oceanospirillaceae bacterium]
MAVTKDADTVTQDKTNTPTKTEPEVKSVSKSADRAAKAKPSASKTVTTASGKHGLLWLLVILLVAAVVGLGYMQWQSQSQYANIASDQTGQLANLQQWQQEQQTLTQEVAQLSATQHSAITQFSQQQGDLSAQVSRMDNALVSSMERMAKAQLDQGLVLPQWQLAEAEYLLRLANQRLAMEQASSSAIALLQAADIIIRDSEQVGTYGVRRAIAADLAALTLVPSIDVEGVYAQLAALTGQASQLTFIAPRAQITPAESVVAEVSASSAATSEAPSNSWTQLLWQSTQAVSASVWGELKQLVKVQSRTQADQQLLTPAAELLVRMRIEMALSQTQVALLRRQQSIYDQSLIQVQQLLQQYYRANDKVAQAMHKQAAALSEVEVLVTMPNISGSLNALQSFIATLHDTPSVSAVQE